ncbi:MAG: hypothetical protein DRP64_08730, partial [Verrucomicrobia bacterium]
PMKTILLILLATLTISAIAEEQTVKKYDKFGYNRNPSPEDLEKLKEIASAGDMGAALELARRYKSGWGVQKDLVEGAKWFRMVEIEDPDVLNANINTPEQLDALKTKANEGDQQAIYELAWRYEDGLGALIEKDLIESSRWYQKLAESGDRRGMMWIGRSHKTGNAELEKDYSKAFHWFNKYIKQPDLRANQKIEAIIEIVGLYRTGDASFPRNEAQALEWFEKANQLANEKGARAQYALACAYESGRSIPQDLTKALELFEKSGASGRWPSSMEKAAAAHYRGKGTPVDKAMAREWVVKLRDCNPDRPCIHFARLFPPEEYAAALAWNKADTTVAEELDQLYEKAYFLETAKGQTKEAFETYRKIIATKATYGTSPIIVKALEQMLDYYSDPIHNPLKRNVQIAKTYLEFCRETKDSPGIYALHDALTYQKNVPELRALQELSKIRDDAITEILKKDDAFKKALAQYVDSPTRDTEKKLYQAKNNAREHFKNNKDYLAARMKSAESVLIRNTRLLEYIINDYEKQNKLFPIDWIEKDARYMRGK